MVQTQEKPQEAAIAVEAVKAKAWAPLSLRLPGEWELSEQRLIELASLNDPWRFERSAEGAGVALQEQQLGVEDLGGVGS